MQEAAEPRGVGLAERLLAARVERPERVAVVGAAPPDDDEPRRLAASQVIRARQLQRGLDRLAAARDRVEASVVDGSSGATSSA